MKEMNEIITVKLFDWLKEQALKEAEAADDCEKEAQWLYDVANLRRNNKRITAEVNDIIIHTAKSTTFTQVAEEFANLINKYEN